MGAGSSSSHRRKLQEQEEAELTESISLAASVHRAVREERRLSPPRAAQTTTPGQQRALSANAHMSSARKQLNLRVAVCTPGVRWEPGIDYTPMAQEREKYKVRPAGGPHLNLVYLSIRSSTAPCAWGISLRFGRRAAARTTSATCVRRPTPARTAPTPATRARTAPKNNSRYSTLFATTHACMSSPRCWPSLQLVAVDKAAAARNYQDSPSTTAAPGPSDGSPLRVGDSFETLKKKMLKFEEASSTSCTDLPPPPTKSIIMFVDAEEPAAAAAGAGMGMGQVEPEGKAELEVHQHQHQHQAVTRRQQQAMEWLQAQRNTAAAAAGPAGQASSELGQGMGPIQEKEEGADESVLADESFAPEAAAARGAAEAALEAAGAAGGSEERAAEGRSGVRAAGDTLPPAPAPPHGPLPSTLVHGHAGAAADAAGSGSPSSPGAPTAAVPAFASAPPAADFAMDLSATLQASKLAFPGAPAVALPVLRIPAHVDHTAPGPEYVSPGAGTQRESRREGPQSRTGGGRRPRWPREGVQERATLAVHCGAEGGGRTPRLQRRRRRRRRRCWC